jgi:peroxiredoxin (alkyl hydroperoxide reductase subunit C)
MKCENKQNCCGGCEIEMPSVARIGHEIPDVEAEAFHNEEIKKIKLSSYRGKWLILFFYPADFTFVCPTELEEMADNYETIQKLEAEVLSISVDTVFAHKAWHDTSPAIKKIKFPMLSDARHLLCHMFDTYIPEEGLSLRGTFVIDPDGILRIAEVHDNSVGRSTKELVRKLQAAKVVREHGGNVCPASWEPGDETLKPGLDLVGKM